MILFDIQVIVSLLNANFLFNIYPIMQHIIHHLCPETLPGVQITFVLGKNSVPNHISQSLALLASPFSL